MHQHRIKSTIIGIFSVAFIASMMLFLSGCPKPAENGGTQEENLRVGTWYGKIDVKASLVMRQDPQYWNSAWHIETTVQLDEFQDGTLKGTAQGDFFNWSSLEDSMFPYSEIATGRYDKYTTFSLEVTGEVTDTGYALRPVELPLQLIDSTGDGLFLDFWDFLFPSEITGTWPDDGSRMMKGESIRPQGDDYRETALQDSFRDFSIVYWWELEKL